MMTMKGNWCHIQVTNLNIMHYHNYTITHIYIWNEKSDGYRMNRRTFARLQITAE